MCVLYVLVCLFINFSSWLTHIIIFILVDNKHYCRWSASKPNNSQKISRAYIDENLSWKAHTKKSSQVMVRLSESDHLCPCTLQLKYTKVLLNCSAVWDGLSQLLSDKLQRLQNRAVRAITKSSCGASFRQRLNLLG